MGVVLGIDVSTTATKAILVDDDGRVLGVGAAEYDFEASEPLWSEQDPGLWWAAVQEAVPRALIAAGLTGDDVVAIGLTGQMHGLVLLDAADEVIRPGISAGSRRTR